MRAFKNIFMALSVVTFAALLVSYQASHAADDNKNKKTSEVRVYEVFGMGCPACQGGLAKLIKKVEGVKAAEVNWKEQRVKVTFADRAAANDELIFDAIRKANFTPGKRLITELSDGNG